MVMMVCGQLVSGSIAKVQPAHRSDLTEEVEGPVDCHQPHLGTAGPDFLKGLVLLRSHSSQYLHPLRRNLVPLTSQLAYSRFEAQKQFSALIDNFFHLQDNKGVLAGQYW